MKRQKFEIMMELADQMVADFESGKYGYICAIGHYDFAKELLEDLIIDQVPIAGLIELHDAEWKGYTDEFIVSLTDEGVTIEQAKFDGKEDYLNIEADKIYVHEMCNSKIIPKLNSEMDKIYEVCFEMSEDECKDCPFCDDYDDEPEECIQKPRYKVGYIKVDNSEKMRDFIEEVFDFFFSSN